MMKLEKQKEKEAIKLEKEGIKLENQRELEKQAEEKE